MTRVLIVDDHEVVRAGLRQLLGSEGPEFIVGEAVNLSDAWTQIKASPWNVVVLDINLPHEDGFQLLKQLRSEKINLPALILSIYSEDVYATEAFRLGALGYLCKDRAGKELVQAIKTVVSGQPYLPNPLIDRSASRRESKDSMDTLSQRERQVFHAMLLGKGVTEVAKQMDLSVKTISTYRSRIFQKLKVKNVMEFYKYASRKGLLVG